MKNNHFTMKNTMIIVATLLLAVSCGIRQDGDKTLKNVETMETMNAIDTNKTLKEVGVEVLAQENQFDLISNQWMLVTAGNKDSFNTMTASWGGFGIIWNRPVAFIFIRPERYTHQFIENSERVTLSFYDEQYRDALNICGTKSGRDTDKVAEAGLTPMTLESGDVTFREARMTIQGRKLFRSDMEKQNFVDNSILEKWYTPQDSLHTIYILEIEKVFVK